jgi:hypothetical protein
MTLLKEDRQIETQYRRGEAEAVETVPAYRVPTLIPGPPPGKRPLWRRLGGSILREIKKTD